MKVLTNMKNCILATDLALFFPNKARLANIVKDNVFDWDQPDHRFFLVPTHKYYQDQPKNAGHGSMHDWKWSQLFLQALGSSVQNLQDCVCRVPWAGKAARHNQARYYCIQGDVEKALGWKPIPLFDRDNYPELASMQVTHIHSFIVILILYK